MKTEEGSHAPALALAASAGLHSLNKSFGSLYLSRNLSISSNCWYISNCNKVAITLPNILQYLYNLYDVTSFILILVLCVFLKFFLIILERLINLSFSTNQLFGFIDFLYCFSIFHVTCIHSYLYF